MPVDEFYLKVRIEPLDEGGFVATSPDLPGLVAQGRTRAETMEIAQDVARRLIESHLEHGDPLPPAVRRAIKNARRVSTVAIPVGLSLPAIWRCPADKTTGVNPQGQRVPRVRSYSINPPVGGPSERSCGGVPWLDFSGLTVYYKLSEMLDPGPSQTFVFLDERVETLGEGVFYLSIAGAPGQPGTAAFYDYPACGHNGAGSFSFADGRVEARRWRDPRTTPKKLTPSGSSYPAEAPSPGNPDLRWLQEHCTRPLRSPP